MFGIEQFVAVLNPPQAAILAVGATVDTPVARDGEVVVRPMLTMTLTVDHRAVDGAPAADFLRTVKRFLEDASPWRSSTEPDVIRPRGQARRPVPALDARASPTTGSRRVRHRDLALRATSTLGPAGRHGARRDRGRPSRRRGLAPALPRRRPGLRVRRRGDARGDDLVVPGAARAGDRELLVRAPRARRKRRPRGRVALGRARHAGGRVLRARTASTRVGESDGRGSPCARRSERRASPEPLASSATNAGSIVWASGDSR